MNKLSVGIVLESSYKPAVGGGFTYYDTMVQHIDQYAFHESLEIIFLNIGQESAGKFQKSVVYINPYKRYTLKDKFREKFVGYLGKPFFQSFGFLRQWHRNYSGSRNLLINKYTEKELIINKIDLLYYLAPADVKLNYPYIMTHWDNGHLSMFSFPEVCMNKIYEYRERYFRFILGKAFAIFCESYTGKDELIRYTNINPDRIFVVPMAPGNVINLVPPLSEQEEILVKYKLERQKFFFYPAQFWSHKNHYNLLVAFKNLLIVDPYIKLVFTGADQGNLNYIKEVISDLQIEKQVTIAGFVDHEILFTFYKNTVALVMPTFLGPTNIPLLEAQAIGCRVICSDLKGHREMLGDSAIYVDPKNPDDISKAMQSSLKSLKEEASLANPVFNIDNAVKQIEKNIREISSRRKTFGLDFLQL
jgi:glycosyltransferase involved in cell wall biosynthesis